MWGSFPYHAVPDGAVFAPHHAYIGLAVGLLAAWVVGDDHPDREPIWFATGVVLALFAFATVWPFYPAPGAILALWGLLVAFVAVLRAPFWQRYRWRSTRGAALVGVLVAADDVVEHAFGVWTPLDQLWKLAIAPLLPGSPVPV